MTPTQFRSTLHAQKVQLTSHEFDLLEKHFAAANEANAPLVNYIAFCDEVGSIFTAKDLEKNPTKTLTAFEAPSILNPHHAELSAAEQEQLDALLMKMGTEVKHRRLLIKPFFQDKDRSRSGFINMSRFCSILDNMRLHVSPAELALINKRFQAKAANEINYVDFDYTLRHYSGDIEMM